MRFQGRRLAALVLSAVMLLQCGCAKDNRKDPEPVERPDATRDVSYVQKKGSLKVGITEYAPLDYLEDGHWVGFDAEMAKRFSEELGIETEFVEINWEKKVALLEAGQIDCIWNGMTRTEELSDTISCTDCYLSNAQVMVIPESKHKIYNTEELCAQFLFSVEEGSAAEDICKEKAYRFRAYDTQKQALAAVDKGEVDAAVLDLLMAVTLTGEGTDYGKLVYDFPQNEEQFCVGFRKDSDLTEVWNTFFTEHYVAFEELAKEYGMEEALLTP